MRLPTLRIIGRGRLWASVSAVLLLIALGGLVTRGLELSIDFVGGTSFRLESIDAAVEVPDLRSAAEAAGASDVIVQLSGEGEGRGALVRTAALEPGSPSALAVREALLRAAGATDVQETFVGPTWGERITRQALQALAVFLVVVSIYISVRLERRMAVAAIVTLAFDVAITVGVYALVGFSVSPATVIAILTIIGYSLYDTVVIFDRVQENQHTLGQPGRRTTAALVNVSLNEVLVRSIATTLTSVLPVGALLLIGGQVLGATTLQDLALALFVGIAIGAYSSIFVAAPLYAALKSREPAERRRVAKAARAGADGADAVVDAAYEGRAPITTDYVRGEGRRGRRRRR
ncbi:MAG: protein translocase subunit SecF [Actinomycetota bacterium]